jgi:hypothetical protein
MEMYVCIYLLQMDPSPVAELQKEIIFMRLKNENVSTKTSDFRFRPLTFI